MINQFCAFFKLYVQCRLPLNVGVSTEVLLSKKYLNRDFFSCLGCRSMFLIYLFQKNMLSFKSFIYVQLKFHYSIVDLPVL